MNSIKYSKLLAIIGTRGLSVLIGSININADTIQDIDHAYQEGVLSGKITPDRYSRGAFETIYNEALKIYFQQTFSGTPAFIAPKALPDYFYKVYAPSKIGSY